MIALMETIVKALVDRTESVSIKEVRGERICVLELRVAKEDLGKVIGKHGRNAQALRTILAAASATSGQRTVLEIIE
jgi:predicted RNA-binding protein YlqC (UPF0109 family)